MDQEHLARLIQPIVYRALDRYFEERGAVVRRQLQGEVRLIDFERQVDGPLLTVTQVVALLQFGEDLVRDLIRAGEIRGVQMGRNYRIVWTSFRNYLLRAGLLPLPPDERHDRSGGS